MTEWYVILAEGLTTNETTAWMANMITAKAGHETRSRLDSEGDEPFIFLFLQEQDVDSCAAAAAPQARMQPTADAEKVSARANSVFELYYQNKFGVEPGLLTDGREPW